MIVYLLPISSPLCGHNVDNKSKQTYLGQDKDRSGKTLGGKYLCLNLDLAFFI